MAKRNEAMEVTPVRMPRKLKVQATTIAKKSVPVLGFSEFVRIAIENEIRRRQAA